MKKKVKWGNAWAILRSGDTTDDIMAQVIHADAMSAYTQGTKGLWRQFGQVCSVVERSEGFPFKFEEMVEATKSERVSAYEAFIHLPSQVTDRLIEAHRLVNVSDDVIIEDVLEDSDPKKA